MAKLKADKVKAPAKYIKELVAMVTYKPEGGVTIAPLSDVRPAVDPLTSLIEDFDEAEDDFD
jgi:hypothetical protein